MCETNEFKVHVVLLFPMKFLNSQPSIKEVLYLNIEIRANRLIQNHLKPS